MDWGMISWRGRAPFCFKLLTGNLEKASFSPGLELKTNFDFAKLSNAVMGDLSVFGA